MKKLITLFLMAFTISSLAHASLIEPDYDPSKPLATTPWYEKYGLEQFMADRSFIQGMRPHHAGALSMSEEYLASETKSSKRLQRLAKSIIDNQTFEILMLDEVENQISSYDFEMNPEASLKQVAIQGLAQRERFSRSPIPSLFAADPATVTKTDVQFAKAMIIHHEGALMMCDAYLADKRTSNHYLELMCLDILRDQAQEIALMRDIIQEYKGNPDTVIIEPHMIHGMDNMLHDMMDTGGASHHNHSHH